MLGQCPGRLGAWVDSLLRRRKDARRPGVAYSQTSQAQYRQGDTWCRKNRHEVRPSGWVHAGEHIGRRGVACWSEKVFDVE